MKIQVITVIVYLSKVILAGNNDKYFVLLFEQHYITWKKIMCYNLLQIRAD